MQLNKFWFVPKSYGWGFVPISWEGWLMTLILIILLISSSYLNDFTNPNLATKNGIRFLFDLIILCTLFTLIAKPKTKGKLKWYWGNRPKNL